MRQLLPAVQFAEFQENLDRYIRDVVPGLPASDAFYDVDRSRPETLQQLHRMAQYPFFDAYRRQPTPAGRIDLVWKACFMDYPRPDRDPARSHQAGPSWGD